MLIGSNTSCVNGSKNCPKPQVNLTSGSGETIGSAFGPFTLGRLSLAQREWLKSRANIGRDQA